MNETPEKNAVITLIQQGVQQVKVKELLSCRTGKIFVDSCRNEINLPVFFFLRMTILN